LSCIEGKGRYEGDLLYYTILRDICFSSVKSLLSKVQLIRIDLLLIFNSSLRHTTNILNISKKNFNLSSVLTTFLCTMSIIIKIQERCLLQDKARSFYKELQSIHYLREKTFKKYFSVRSVHIAKEGKREGNRE
jgi:hypothetical protein